MIDNNESKRGKRGRKKKETNFKTPSPLRNED